MCAERCENVDAWRGLEGAVGGVRQGRRSVGRAVRTAKTDRPRKVVAT